MGILPIAGGSLFLSGHGGSGAEFKIDGQRNRDFDTLGLGSIFLYGTLICESDRFRVSASGRRRGRVVGAATEETFYFIYKPVSQRFWII